MRKLFIMLMTLAAVSWSAIAQTRTVSGTVVDAGNNEPLIGVTVLPIGGGQGAATDVDGSFTITVPANVKQAKFSYVGYKEVTEPLHDKMVVRMASSSTDLDDLIVVAYGTANKESLTGSVAVVGASEIEDRPVTSVTAALEGNAPGVQVNNSTGAPGSSPAIRIRGFNSFNSAAQSPLYVVDGVIYEGDVASISPSDIESMSVLKDAASCALYGSRGANGVILISTKRAKSVGKVDVTATVRLGSYGRGIPFYKRLGAGRWSEQALRGLANGAVTNSGGASTYEAALKSQMGSFFSSFCQGTNVFNMLAADVFNENGEVLADVNPYYTDLDWWDPISQTGLRQEYSLNAAGASEKFNSFASITYLKENGYIRQTDFERFTGRVTANYTPVSYFKTGLNLSANYVKSQVGDDNVGTDYVTNPFLSTFYAPIQPYYAHDPETGEMLYNEDGSHIWNTDAINKGDNMAWTLRLNRNNYNSSTIDASAYATAVIPYGFEFTVQGSLFFNKASQTTYSNNQVGSQKGIGGLDQGHGTSKSYTFQQQLTWSHEYGLHHIDALLLHQNFKSMYDTSSIRMSGQFLPGIYALSNFENRDDAGESINAYTTESYLGRARYNYDQKYFGEFSINRDGSSQFYKDNRWGTFWSVGASWIISKEKFMQNLHWLNYLKLRAAYGSVGNNVAAGYQAYLNLYSFINNAIIPTQIGNEKLKWEATKTLDIALEGSLFNDRFTFSIGYFNKVNSDLIYSLRQPGSAGSLGMTGSSPAIATNIGTMENNGWELQFGVDIIRNQNVKWNFNCDFSFVNNNIKKLPYGHNIVNSALFQGKSLYEHYDYVYAGVDQMNGRALYEMVPESRDYYYYDENDNWVYDRDLYEQNLADAKKDGSYVEINGKGYTYKTQYAGRRIIDSALPTVYGSFGTNVSWKGINFGMLFTYSIGGTLYDSNYARLMGFSADSPSALHKDILKAWTAVPEGMTEDSPNRIDKGGIPQINSVNGEFSNASSSRWLISSSYLALKNISLSYDLPMKWSNALKLQNINVGFFMDNVFLACARSGMNPTYNFAGGQGTSYVPNRTYTFQLSVKF